MAAPSSGGGPVVESKDQLIAWFAEGEKPREAWRIGTEHEKFAFRQADHAPLSYDGAPGIRDLLEGLQRFGWEPVYEGENVIALTGESGANISLEPGGQFELSGAPLETLHQTCDEVHEHLKQLREVNRELGVAMLGIGFHPFLKREDAHWMPKGRYKVMREYMPKVGTMGLDMMLRTCTVQVNLDFDSERDMARKMRIGMALQPIATALFANSPFREGRRTDYLSLRSHVWTDTDNDRSGILPFVFDDDFGVAEQHLEYAFRHCKSDSRRNKALILRYLLPVKLLMGKMPTAMLLQKYGLGEYVDVVSAMKSGNVRMLNDALKTHQISFIKQGTFLVLEKLRNIVLRTLFQKVHAFSAEKNPAKGNQVNLHMFLAALKWCGCDMDIDEVEMIVANLIFRKFVKGYISHKSRVVVLAKAGAFPAISYDDDRPKIAYLQN